MANILFEGCYYSGYQFFTNESNWTGATSAVTSVFSFQSDTTVPDGCYTIVSAFTSGFTSVSFIPDGVYTLQANCSASACNPSAFCSNEICIQINNDIYSGYSGNYEVAGVFNNYPYWSGSTNGKIFYEGSRWCLSNSLSGNCYFFGSEPTNSTCPDLSETIYYTGTCLPTPTTTNPCTFVDEMFSFIN